MNVDKDRFLKSSLEALEGMYSNLEKLPELNMNELEGSKTALIVIDMINGFAREGVLKSERVEKLIEPIVDLMKKCEKRDIKKLAFADCHSEDALEFESYPPHCITGTRESDIVEEILAEGSYKLIPKNSTNGFLEEEFQKWLDENKDIDTFIVTGDCTDICILQFAVTLKAYFNTKNIKRRIIVPVNAVDTYDIGVHNGELLNIVSLQIMQWNGIELVKQIME